MITFTILLALVVAIASIVLTLGAGVFAIFGDLIVFGLIIWLLVKLFRRNKKK